MIEFFSETDFELSKKEELSNWISSVITSEGFSLGDVTYVFCDDAYLHQLNVEFLDHDTLTDIISFDYSMGKEVHGEIYISIERVKENALQFNTTFETELHRVIIHGVLHYCGYKDKTTPQITQMRAKEDAALARRDFL
ncbi:MAG: rRNA maturation RNase YbeY [Flavobacteriales bacterium]|jgi:probable rRNA maturation factor|uniref:rRNA maturation RNase YbeY n=1 Tax=Candidatus Ulvibacter alkanivorans TaxID=2267620 RepID=UPI000DF494F9|nr:rRNA maturation RNase YbeY [Candidatus Ulvibacter alkanivorans]MCH2489889.1 rRNA maturation RNase YbeY [Flavobacteriales bacterium]